MLSQLFLNDLHSSSTTANCTHPLGVVYCIKEYLIYFLKSKSPYTLPKSTDCIWLLDPNIIPTCNQLRLHSTGNDNRTQKSKCGCFIY